MTLSQGDSSFAKAGLSRTYLVFEHRLKLTFSMWERVWNLRCEQYHRWVVWDISSLDLCTTSTADHNVGGCSGWRLLLMGATQGW
jgi:hypothetical protein